jgi:hypothetical protein
LIVICASHGEYILCASFVLLSGRTSPTREKAETPRA